MKPASIINLLLLSAIAVTFATTAPAQPFKGPFGASEWQLSAAPLHPGQPGVSPFWNTFAPRFIYAPAFDYKPVPGAATYRFEITSTAAGVAPAFNPPPGAAAPTRNSKLETRNSPPQLLTFTAPHPWSPLTPIWTSLPVGNFTLRVTALSPDGKPLGTAGTGTYYRAAPYDGPYLAPVIPYDASGKLALEKALSKPYVQYWLTHKEPDFGYYFYRFPKLYGALITGAVAQARLHPGTDEAARMTELARIVADYTISISFPKGSHLEYFPPSYYGKTVGTGKRKNSHVQINNYMIIGAAETGHAYLNLYDLTGDKKYFDAALRIAQTYQKTQLPSGTWTLYINHETGQPTAPQPAIPTSTIAYFERLKNDYKVEGLQPAIDRAFAWVMENPAKDFFWLAQYEDIALTNAKKYERMSREQPCDLAIYLFKTRANDPKMVALAEDLIRFCEDQFITWEQMEDVLIHGGAKRQPFRDDAQPPGWYSRNWLLPVVHEQYNFWMPSARNTGLMIETYWQAYQVTKKEVYLSKAISIANNFTRVQSLHDGEYPTFFTTYPLNYWLNNSIYPAIVMIQLQKDLAAIDRAPQKQ